MARGGIREPVYCWLPDYATVCRRYRRWIGPGTNTLEDQRDLHCAPDVLAAAQCHARLHHRHNDAARFAVKDAARIHRCWACSTSTSPSELPPADVDAHVAAYPDLVALAAILADARVRIWNSVAATPARARAVDEVYISIGCRFPQRRDQTRPIEQWIHDQQLSAAHHAHRADRVDSTTSSNPAMSVPGLGPAERRDG